MKSIDVTSAYPIEVGTFPRGLAVGAFLAPDQGALRLPSADVGPLGG
jgi:hypothetical protein